MSSAAKKITTHVPGQILKTQPKTQAKTTSIQSEELAYNWRVLIVEDEPAIAEGIQAIIAPPANVLPMQRSSRSARPPVGAQSSSPATPVEKDQFSITWAKNPTEALQIVREAVQQGKPFAMGFFDVLLGGDIDGIELVRQIHTIDPKMYAVFVTAYHDRTVDAINQILGPDKSDRWDYMNKPFTDGAILQKARNAVSMWNLREQKKQHEEQLAEAARLLLEGERINTVAAVGRSVAHEFGNLLMQIIGHAEIATIKGDVSTMQNALKTILKAGDTATAVLNKFKRMHHQGGEEAFSKVFIDKSINEAVDLMTHEFKKNSIKITRPIFHSFEIDANHHSLMQVFMNIFINAVHAMKVSGQIDLSIEKFQHPDHPNVPWIEIKVRDHGPGVPEENIPKMTEAFFTTKGQQGTGLGLAICKDIIENEHQGELRIANHPMKGLVITIRLPQKQEVSGEHTEQ